MRSPWKVVERCEWTFVAFCTIALIINFASCLVKFGK